MLVPFSRSNTVWFSKIFCFFQQAHPHSPRLYLFSLFVYSTSMINLGIIKENAF
ncbi:hypothetical protein BSM4216_0033 [Bacillus smithii]|nr:hypothetical protein BSM4216_0033 [Bacillus smithii]